MRGNEMGGRERDGIDDISFSALSPFSLCVLCVEKGKQP
jgi:hypothetical protein